MKIAPKTPKTKPSKNKNISNIIIPLRGDPNLVIMLTPTLTTHFRISREALMVAKITIRQISPSLITARFKLHNSRVSLNML